MWSRSDLAEETVSRNSNGWQLSKPVISGGTSSLQATALHLPRRQCTDVCRW